MHVSKWPLVHIDNVIGDMFVKFCSVNKRSGAKKEIDCTANKEEAF